MRVRTPQHKRGALTAAVPGCALVFGSAFIAALGCGTNESDTSSKAPDQTSVVKAPTAPETRPPSVRTSGAVWRSLLDEAGRAELDLGGASGGLFIDFGTADQHKYTRGGWRTGWSGSRRIDDATVTQVHGDRAVLDVVVDGEVRELVARARAARDGVRVTAYLGKTRVGDATLSTEWQVVRVPIASAVMPAGRQQLVLRFADADKGGEATAPDGKPDGKNGASGAKDAQKSVHMADFDWLWLTRATGAPAPDTGPRVQPVRLGGQPKRALNGATSRSYHVYLQPRADSRLVFDYGAQNGARFSVRARIDRRPDAATEATPELEKELFSATGSDAWQEASVELGEYAGRALQLRLEVRVPAGSNPGAAGWAEPVIMRVEAAQRVRRPAPKRAKNAILVVLDTARADVYGPFAGAATVHTPNFDALAERSAIFENAYNNENWTKPSVASTLSSLYPSTHDTKRDGSVLPAGVELLPQHLQKRGFQTAGFVANGYISEFFGFEKGWHEYVNYIRDRVPSHAERVFSDAQKFLSEHRKKRADTPFFLYIQTIDPHVVYDVPRKYSKRYYKGSYKGFLGSTIDAGNQIELARRNRGEPAAPGDSHADWLRALYYGEVTYHDEHLGGFIKYLDESGTLDDTLLVVTNDHGEELGERGYYGHGHSLYQEMIRAPLIMHFPPVFAAGTRVPDIVENVDVAPTILDILGQPPLKDAEGQSLLPLFSGASVVRPGYAITEFLDGRRSVRVGRYTFMRSIGTWMHLFDVEADGDQRDDLIDSHPIARRLCEVYLGEGLATPDKRKRQNDLVSRRRLVASEAEITAGVRRQLSALGYFGDSEDRSEDDASD